MTFHESEETIFLEDILYNEMLDGYRDDIREFLEKHYHYDQEAEEFDTPLASGYRKYTIRTANESECGEDCFKNILNIEIDLPDNAAAQELADIIDGKVVSGMTGKQFRITYRNEIYITAESEEDAQAAFENMDTDELARRSTFVEMSSLEPQD